MARGGTAMITGAASGIGRAIAAQLAADGAERLILLDLDRAGLEGVAAELRGPAVTTVAVDIGDAQAMTAAFDGLLAEGVALDFLFNNAGIPAGTPAWPDTDLARIAAIVNTNLLGLLYATRLALPLMPRGGSVLNTASTSGLRPYLSGAVYASTKAAVIMFTQSCAELSASHGVRVNAICPGIVRTPFIEKTGLGGKAADWLAERLKGRLLEPADVARAAIALARDPARAGHYEVMEAS